MKKLLSIFLTLVVVAFAACNDDDDNKTTVPNDVVKSFIETNYPGATILEIEKVNGGLTEVDVMHDSKKKDIYFNNDNVWVYTEWDVLTADVPQVVLDKVAEMYPEYSVDNVDYIQSPDGDFYEVEIEKGNFEKHLKVSLDASTVTEM